MKKSISFVSAILRLLFMSNNHCMQCDNTINQDTTIERNADGMTPLMITAERGDIDTVQDLVATQYRCISKIGRTALMCAAYNGNVECVRILSDYEACMRESDGATALMLATNCRNNTDDRIECVTILAEKECRMKDDNGMTALMRAAQNGANKIVRILSQYGTYERDKNGRTALMHAACEGHVECVSILAKCSDIFAQDSNGKTALDYASEFNIHLYCEAVRDEIDRDNIKKTRENIRNTREKMVEIITAEQNRQLG